MLGKHLKYSFRLILKHKLYAALNIIGLAAGISAFVLIVLFIKDEMSYDQFHENANRIYRVVEIIDLEGQGEESSSNPFPVGPTLFHDYPHLIEASTRFFNFQFPNLTLEKDNQKFNEPHIFFADSTVFHIFNFPLIEGDPEKALAAPNSIVMTERLAHKYFGDEDPMGQMIKFEGAIDVQVTGILEEVPDQSHIEFDALVSFGTVRNMMGPNYDKNWVWNPCWTYVLLKDGVAPTELAEQFPEFIKKYYPDFIKPQITHLLQPLKDIHLSSKLSYEIQPNGDRSNLFVMGLIGIFVLLIACINFTNLSTARSANRAREVGIRKVAGATRGNLILQFLTESLLLSFIAVVLAVVLIELSLPFFNNISGKHIGLYIFSDPSLIVTLVLTGLITGVLSGIYPAFYLSSFMPVKVLKGTLKSGSTNKVLRQGLVIVQFTICLTLIISTIIIYQQLRYMQSADLGFNKEQVIMIQARAPMIPKFETFETEVLKHANVQSITILNDILGQSHNVHEYNYEGMQPEQWKYYPSLIVNEHFVETFKLKLIAGRDFSEDHAREDSLSLLVNRAMVEHLNWGTPEEAIGQQLFTPHGKERVIGVVENFNFVNLKDPVGPFVLDISSKRLHNFFLKYVAVRIGPGDIPATLAYIEEQWNAVAPQYPFEYYFLDDRLKQQYHAQENMAKVVGYFSLFTIIIASLGLFALASFTAEQRTKEIGIRKVLGASAMNISGKLSKDFLKLVLLAAVLAWPLAWIVMSRWLATFAYRTNIDLLVFLEVTLGVLLLALLTVIFQTVKAALGNPVKALKYE